MKLVSRINLIIRRIHLYSGIFLLPWVLMYGITGAMYNHLGLFPRMQIQPMDPQASVTAGLNEFPNVNQLATQVVEAIQKNADSSRIKLSENAHAEFTNEISFEVKQDGLQRVVYINPVTYEEF
ncbi:MAG: hypothetical protein U0936_00065 [Planctomycetaceae bacterium]